MVYGHVVGLSFALTDAEVGAASASRVGRRRLVCRPSIEGQRFLALDLDHHGYLTLAGLETIRPAPPAEPNKPETVNEAEGDPASQ